jgi:small subunit ribosomal protein S17
MSDVTPETPDIAEDTAAAPEAPTTSAAPVPGVSAREAAEATRPSRVNRRKVREGLVSSSTMEKTVVVDVIERVRHPRYAKTVQRTKHFYAHDEGNQVRVGDRVRIQETRPMSKLKRWRVVDVLERAR